MRRMTCGLGLVFLLAVPFGLWAAEPDTYSGPSGCPTLIHAPITTIARGVPAVISAKVSCTPGQVTSVRLHLRLLDAGKPVPVEMSGVGEGLYQATVPLSMIQGLARFWYYVDVRGRSPAAVEEGVAQTRWYPVTIVDAGEGGGEGAAGSGAAGGKTIYWLLGGLGVAGGAAVIEHNQGGSGGGGATPPPSNTPPPTVVRDNRDTNRDDDDDKDKDEDEEDPAPYVCVTTGNESVEYAETLPCTSPDIEIRVCGTCTNATLEAEGSWGASDQVTGYNQGSCAPTAPAALTLSKPEDVNYIADEFTITVRANGQVISTRSWPSASEVQDCL